MSSRVSVFLALAMTAPLFAHAQEVEVKIHQQSETPSAARFQVVQSSSMARDTFRLDRFTGRVWQIVQNTEGSLVWQQMPVRALPEVNASAPRFQIFLSSTLRRISLLVDTSSGQCWQLQSVRIDPEGPDTDANKTLVWEPIANE